MKIFNQERYATSYKLINSIIILILLFIFSISQNCSEVQEEPGNKRRIISLSPFITEIIYALGVDDELIAVTDFCSFPQDAGNKTKIGGLLDPNIEMIIALKPTHILGQPAHAGLNQQLARFGLHIVAVANENIDDIFNAIKTIGKVLDCNTQAAHLISVLQDSLNRIRDHTYPPASPLIMNYPDSGGSREEDLNIKNVSRFQAESTQYGDTIKAMLIIGREKGSLRNIMVAGNNTFIGEMWQLAGGHNLYPDLTTHYSMVSLESIIIRNPDVIIEFDSGQNRRITRDSEISEWELLKEVNAVKQGNLFLVSGNYIFISGPRFYLLARDFKKIMNMLH
jgi:iron complex transport system substrate-binding protein